MSGSEYQREGSFADPGEIRQTTPHTSPRNEANNARAAAAPPSND